MTEEERKELEYELEIRKKLLDFYVKSGHILSYTEDELEENKNILLEEIFEILQKLKSKD